MLPPVLGVYPHMSNMVEQSWNESKGGFVSHVGYQGSLEMIICAKEELKSQ